MGDGDGDKVAGNEEVIGEGGKSDGIGNKGGRQATAATMAMGMRTVQRTWSLVL